MAFVVCFLLVGIWIHQLLQGRERSIESAKVNTANLVRIIEEANNRTIQAIDLTLANVSINMNPDRWSDNYAAKDFLQSLLNESPQVREVAFADKNGRIVASSRREKLDDLSIENEKCFLQARAGILPHLYISSPKPGRLLGDKTENSVGAGHWHLIMARAVRDETEAFVGVALAVINPGFFQEQILALDVGDKGFVSYYKYDGTLLFQSGSGSFLRDTENNINQQLFSKHLAVRDWGTFIQNSGVDDGKTYIVSYRATSRWPLLVAVGLEQNEVLIPWRVEVRDFSVIMGGSLMILLGLAFMVFHKHVLQEQMVLQLREAHHDPLTGIPSLRLCLDRLSNALLRAHRTNDPLAVFFIDLDGFKEINDNNGHDAGDYVLKETANRLKMSVRQMDTVARLGGDEFLVILPKIKDLSVVEKVGANIVESVKQDINWQGKILSVSASVGIAIYPEHGDEPEQLIKNADKAMYYAKRKGKNQYVVATL